MNRGMPLSDLVLAFAAMNSDHPTGRMTWRSQSNVVPPN
jgi:hypothetical protein